MINETLKNFIQPQYAKTKRGPETYASTFAYTYAQLEAALAEYRSCSEDVQTRRLIRDTIDYHLRRCHGYCIKENFGSHYRQRNVEGKKVFEHMIPNKTVRDLLIGGYITPQQACNPPTCILSEENDAKLRKAGWVSKTPDVYNFWKRYCYCFETEGVFETYTGKTVNTDMSLKDHFQMILG